MKGMKMDRTEHLQWCKDRALEYVRSGDLTNAITSFQSDMRKHVETVNHSALELMTMMMLSGHLETATEVEKFIKSFN